MTTSVRRRCQVAMPALLAAALASGGVAAQAPQAAGERSIVVTVLDQSGVPVKDLGAADFEVREDNLKREVTSAKIATDAPYIAVLVDTSKPPADTNIVVRDMRTALTAFMNALLATNPQTLVSYGEFGGAAVTKVKFTSKAEDLTKATSRLYPSEEMGGVELEALADAGKNLAKTPASRRIIVAINLNSPEMSQMPPKSVADEVAKSGAQLWAVSVNSSTGASIVTLDRNADPAAGGGGLAPARELVLNNVTMMTGGARLTGISTGGLETMLKNLADNLASQYVITYKTGGKPAPVQVGASRGAKLFVAAWVPHK